MEWNLGIWNFTPATQPSQGPNAPCDWHYPGGHELYRDVVQLPRKQLGRANEGDRVSASQSLRLALINVARPSFLPCALFRTNDDRLWHKHGHVGPGKGTYDGD